ncbi:MAG: phosphoribosylamine--glycine ligase, partial [Candidatus Methylomirabilis sp.]|nr:phosphoribosylamine--glycine ligase [Deltaproteobacteria bacterium]
MAGKKKVLVVGGGGREHALAWRLALSPSVGKVYCAPGNGGVSQHAECVPIAAGDVDKLTAFAQEKKVDLTFVGPELPL